MRVAILHPAGAQGLGDLIEGLRSGGLDVEAFSPNLNEGWARVLGDLEIRPRHDLYCILGDPAPLAHPSLLAVPLVVVLTKAPEGADLARLARYVGQIPVVATAEEARHPDLKIADLVALDANAPERLAAIFEKAVADWATSERRPWGYYKILDETLGHKVKRIVVEPGESLSLQLHHRRAEHWTVVSGEALVTRDSDEIRLGPGESVDIPLEAKHSIACAGDEPMVFIEVQHGEYFGEDDIVRFKDKYGRVK